MDATSKYKMSERWEKKKTEMSGEEKKNTYNRERNVGLMKMKWVGNGDSIYV